MTLLALIATVYFMALVRQQNDATLMYDLNTMKVEIT